MLSPLILRLDADLEGGWSVALGTPDVQPARGHLTPSDVEAIVARVEAASLPGRVVIRGKVAGQERLEAEAGRALAAVFRPIAVHRRLVEHRALATSEGVSAVLVVECAGPEIAALPWELVAEAPDGPPLEESTGAVVRLGLGRPSSSAQRSASRLRMLLWCPTPGDPACMEVMDALRATRIAGAELLELPRSLGSGLPLPEEGAADLLVLVCHGAADAGGSLLAFGGDGQREGGPGSLVAALAPGLPSLVGVVVGVCEAGAPSEHQLGDLAGRLLLAGARAVVSAAVPVGAEALVAFTLGLLESLVLEAPPALAVRSARHAVGRLLIPHPDSRPSAFRVAVADLSALRSPWIVRQWRPHGWPTTDPELSGLLSRAYALAEPLGWIGVEHLLEVWPENATGLAGDLRRGICSWDGAFARRLRAGHARRVEGRPLLSSPRLRRLAAALPGERASLTDLACALIEDPSHALHLLAPRPLGELRWDPLGSQVSLASQGARALPEVGAPATRFEVLWGPEDGRRLQPDPGHTIGRWHQPPADEHLLFEDTPVVDRHLHRQHLRYRGPGEVELLRRGRVLRYGAGWQDGVEETGYLRIGAGDLILLTPGTWLRALGPG